MRVRRSEEDIEALQREPDVPAPAPMLDRVIGAQRAAGNASVARVLGAGARQRRAPSNVVGSPVAVQRTPREHGAFDRMLARAVLARENGDGAAAQVEEDAEPDPGAFAAAQATSLWEADPSAGPADTAAETTALDAVTAAPGAGASAAAPDAGARCRLR